MGKEQMPESTATNLPAELLVRATAAAKRHGQPLEAFLVNCIEQGLREANVTRTPLADSAVVQEDAAAGREENLALHLYERIE
jgi:hypothetical protein